MSKQRGDFEWHISGIPCQIQVKEFNRVVGSGRYDAPSDLDFYGYFETEFAVLDRKGYPAAWLERKLDDRACELIEQEIWKREMAKSQVDEDDYWDNLREERAIANIY